MWTTIVLLFVHATIRYDTIEYRPIYVHSKADCRVASIVKLRTKKVKTEK